MMHATYDVHTPVLLGEVLESLAPKKGESYLDLTAGYGGHAQAILEYTQSATSMTLVDRDQSSQNFLAKFAEQGAQLVHRDFLGASKQLADEENTYDMILADLGVSSLHLNEAVRGFSFGKDGPLDMRMDQRAELMAADVVNTYSLDALTRIIREYGEEPRARRVAERIIESRPLETTGQLADVVASALPKGSKKHPATKTFQALRIAVNDELTQVAESLPLWLTMLKPGGRLAVISFHSLEDRIVKHAFAAVSGERYDADFHAITKHPVVASDDEIVSNPRSRSAKLRGVAKINTKERG